MGLRSPLVEGAGRGEACRPADPACCEVLSNRAQALYPVVPAESASAIRPRTIGDLPAHLVRLARTALVAEASLTPKPGLVDRRNTGAHDDMDLGTFLASAEALEPLFARYVEAGARLGAGDVDELADELRRIGIEAEAAMFAATGGVNTHKGANFSFALILGAVGALVGEGARIPFSPADTARVLATVSRMGAQLLDADARELLVRTQAGAGTGAGAGPALTHGERILFEEGLQGARGEAARGYPLLAEVLLPYLRSALEPETSIEAAGDVLLRALVKLMAELEDTNVVHRGGTGALAAHRAFCRALDARELTARELERELVRYDDELIARHISPGGAADLLSLGIFFAQLEGLLTSEKSLTAATLP